MEWIDFVSLMKYMVDTYGVPYGYSTEDRDYEYEFPTNEEDCECAWFECCECGEPILYCDWKDEEFSEYDMDGETVVRTWCPICENDWYNVEEED